MITKATSTKPQGKTLEITDFTGRLTRKLNGDLNSGFAKFDKSWGYDPFSKPGNLTWFEAPTDLDPTDANVGLTMVAGKPRIEAGNQLYIYTIGTNYSNLSKLFKIQPNSVGNPNLDSPSVIAQLSNNSFLFGGDMEFYGSDGAGNPHIYFGNDNNVSRINVTGASEATVSPSASYIANIYRALEPFVGNLYFANGSNIGEIGSGETVTNYNKLSPPLAGSGSTSSMLTGGVSVRDLGVTPTGTYLSIAASTIPSPRQDYAYDRISAATGTGYLFNWNGVDQGITNYKTFPSHAVTAFKTYLANQYLFSNDTFGMSIDSGDLKIRTLQNNSSTYPNAIATNGNFISWMSTEFVDSTMKASMYYYGQLDEETPTGLWRMFRLASTQASGFIYTVPFNILAGNKFSTLNSGETAVATYGYGKHYFSTYDISNGGGTIKYKLYRFLVTPTGTGTPTSGVWESQTELFSKKISLSEVRVYTEPTATGNGYQLDLIGMDGNVIPNATFNYSFGSATDSVSGSSVIDRVTFNPGSGATYALGVRLTNTGSTNMTFKKIEIDIEQGGK